MIRSTEIVLAALIAVLRGYGCHPRIDVGANECWYSTARTLTNECLAIDTLVNHEFAPSSIQSTSAGSGLGDLGDFVA